jgi:hypothetical protein
MNEMFFFIPASPEQEREDFRLVLKQPAARRVFRRMLAAANVMGGSRGEGEGTTDYNEGIRAVGLWLAARIEAAAPGELSRLMLESSLDRMAAMANEQQEER